MINEDALRTYLFKEFSNALAVDIRKLGSGVQGSGFLVEVKLPSGVQSYVVKKLLSEGLGHDYPSDRAAVFLLDLDEYKNLPKHVAAIDVLAEHENGSIQPIGGGREYYLLMEKVEGQDYFVDLGGFARKDRLSAPDIGKIRSMSAYLASIHAVKKDSRELYWRKIRDTIGHGECLMGVFDTYPDGVMSYEDMAEIEKLCVDWRARLKPRAGRLCQIHGDFHPGNIWFKTEKEAEDFDFVLLDRSRGPWGDAADDVTALTINYLFFSLRTHGTIKGSFLEALHLFFEQYVSLSGDDELYEVLAPFFAFRGVVVANPVFYPEVTQEVRTKIFKFVRKVLSIDKFEVSRVIEYIK
ncbi:MAG: aminoglycoside phosphotransferase family protein [Nitrospirae bacterium]|nr:aminoglycoside phosphotransferase family protein [Nitrospirota bacterium]